MSNLQKVNKFQNEGGSDVYCEDYDLANKGTKSTVASDDYVVLEDVNGDYQKIAKASFVDAVRDALGTVLNNLDKGSSAITRVPAIAGSDLGSATLANLASALGVHTFSAAISNGQTYTLPFGSVALVTARNVHLGKSPLIITGFTSQMLGDSSNANFTLSDRVITSTDSMPIYIVGLVS